MLKYNRSPKGILSQHTLNKVLQICFTASNRTPLYTEKSNLLEVGLTVRRSLSNLHMETCTEHVQKHHCSVCHSELTSLEKKESYNLSLKCHQPVTATVVFLLKGNHCPRAECHLWEDAQCLLPCFENNRYSACKMWRHRNKLLRSHRHHRKQRGQLIYIPHKCYLFSSTYERLKLTGLQRVLSSLKPKLCIPTKVLNQICTCSHSQASPYSLPAELSHYNMWKGQDKQPGNFKTFQCTAENNIHFQW